jgi:hypothetical protein
MKDKIGNYAFVLGVVLAVAIGILAGIIGQNEGLNVLFSLLIILGFIVGLINVTDVETREFLEIATMLVIVAFAGGSDNLKAVIGLGSFLQPIFQALMVFIFPAAIIVALKEVLRISKHK